MESQTSAQGVDLLPRVDLGGAIDIARVTAIDVAFAVGIIVVSFVLAGLVRRWVRRRLLEWDAAPDYLAPMASRFASWAVILIGLVTAADFLGVHLNDVLLFFLLAVAVLAFAGSDLLRNVAAASVLQAGGPFRAGDQIEYKDSSGTVVEVNSRLMVIRTVDGRIVHEPNIDVLNGAIVNLVQDGQRRSSLVVSLAYDTDLRRAKEVMEDAMLSLQIVRPDPAPAALVTDFAESTIEWELRFWHAPLIDQAAEAKSAVAIAVREALRDGGIEIAFPQRVLSFSESADELLRETVG